jgi:ankyrin repeat protein
LSSKPALNLANSSGETLLGKALVCGDSDLLEMVLSAGADPNQNFVENPGERPQFPLDFALRTQSKAILQMLLEKGATVPKSIEEEFVSWVIQVCCFTTFFNHVQNGHSTILKLAIENGLDVNTRVVLYSRSLLGIACLHSQPKIVKMLLSMGADARLN